MTWFNDMFINEAKPALSRHSGSGSGSSADIVEVVGSDTLTWDGNTEGRASIPMEGSGTYYNVGAAPLTKEDIANKAILNDEHLVAEDEILDMGELSGMTELEGVLYILNAIYIYPHDVEINGALVERGIYFLKGADGTEFEGQLITSLTIPGYTGFNAQEKIKPSMLYQPDWNQTDATKPDFVKNKPFGEVYGDTLTWDGNTEGLVGVDLDGIGSNTHWLVSDTVLTMDDLTNGGTITSNSVTAEIMPEDSGVGFIMVAGFSVISADETAVGVDLDGIVFPKAGIYMAGACSITIPGYTGFPSTRKLDAKYLPGAAMLYADEENYLCSDVDGTTRLTRPEFLQMANSGMPMMFYMGTSCMNWATFGDAGTFAAAVAMNALSGEVVPVILYTAEYTPESTASE